MQPLACYPSCLEPLVMHLISMSLCLSSQHLELGRAQTVPWEHRRCHHLPLKTALKAKTLKPALQHWKNTDLDLTPLSHTSLPPSPMQLMQRLMLHLRKVSCRHFRKKDFLPKCLILCFRKVFPYLPTPVKRKNDQTLVKCPYPLTSKAVIC